MPTIVQLSDLHLFADPDARLRGVPTRQTLRDVLPLVAERCPDFDYLVISGDLAHDELPETYDVLLDLLGDWTPRCLVIPGNHDNRSAIRAAFPTVPAGDGPIGFSRPVGDWQLIGLDSHVPGEVPGRVEPAQLDWLEAQLTEHAARPTALFVHHPPASVASPWLDSIGLREPQRLLQIVAAAPQLRLVCCGHVHQQYATRCGGAMLVTAPSTALQFAAGTSQAAMSGDPPGFSVIKLALGGPADAEFSVETIRTAELRFPPQPE